MRVNFEGEGGGGGLPAPQAPKPAPGKRPLDKAILRCPECGTGALFDGFLRVRPTCRVCGEDFSHHRADDLPPYLTIIIVGHLVVAGVLMTERAWHPSLWLQAAIWLPATLVLSLLLVRPLKGAVVGLQWALGMHGFGRRPPPLVLPPKAP